MKGSSWGIETVDLGLQLILPSLATDSKNNPHISYIIQSNGGALLKYAKRIGGFWVNESLDSSVAFDLHHSLALDSNDNPHIAYHVSTQNLGVLKYARWNGTEWSFEKVDMGDDIGQRPSLALDSNDDPHITYYDGYMWCTKYARWTGSNWSIEVLGPSGSWSSMAIDSMNNPHVAYAYGSLKYAQSIGGHWSNRTVDSNETKWASLALDNHDNPHISYVPRLPEHGLLYSRLSGDSWRIEIVDADVVYSRRTSLALDNHDNSHIGYANDTLAGSTIKYVTWIGNEWKSEAVDAGLHSSLALDSDGNIHISYAQEIPESHDHYLKYATKPGGALSPSISLNIDPDTLNLKSKGRWITAYLTTEGAKAEDIEPSSLMLNDVLPPSWWDIQNETTLMVKFNRAAVQALLPISETVDIKVTGKWKDGETFELHDVIRVIERGRVAEGASSLIPSMTSAVFLLEDIFEVDLGPSIVFRSNLEMKISDARKPPNLPLRFELQRQGWDSTGRVM